MDENDPNEVSDYNKGYAAGYAAGRRDGREEWKMGDGAVAPDAKQIDDGGPAFPRSPLRPESVTEIVPDLGSPGMSLRAWFAGQALAGLLAGEPEDQIITIDTTACDAVSLADATIAALQKTKS